MRSSNSVAEVRPDLRHRTFGNAVIDPETYEVADYIRRPRGLAFGALARPQEALRGRLPWDVAIVPEWLASPPAMKKGCVRRSAPHTPFSRENGLLSARLLHVFGGEGVSLDQSFLATTLEFLGVDLRVMVGIDHREMSLEAAHGAEQGANLGPATAARRLPPAHAGTEHRM